MLGVKGYGIVPDQRTERYPKAPDPNSRAKGPAPTPGPGLPSTIADTSHLTSHLEPRTSHLTPRTSSLVIFF